MQFSFVNIKQRQVIWPLYFFVICLHNLFWPSFRKQVSLFSFCQYYCWSLWWKHVAHDSQDHKRFGRRVALPLTMSLIKKIFKNITVEPIFFLYNLNFATYYIIFQNLQIEKACRVNLNQTETICGNLKDPANQNVQVNPSHGTAFPWLQCLHSQRKQNSPASTVLRYCGVRWQKNSSMINTSTWDTPPY